jgi:hypothetical protein
MTEVLVRVARPTDRDEVLDLAVRLSLYRSHDFADEDIRLTRVLS